MAQKVNPIAVRLQFNRSSDSSWFSDYYYAVLLYQDLSLKNYLNTIRPPTGNQLGLRIGRCVVSRYPKRSLIHLFYLAVTHKVKSKPAEWRKGGVASSWDSIASPAFPSSKKGGGREADRRVDKTRRGGNWSRALPEGSRSTLPQNILAILPQGREAVEPSFKQGNFLLPEEKVDFNYWASKDTINKTTGENSLLPSISTTKACFNYYAMQYFFFLKLHLRASLLTKSETIRLGQSSEKRVSITCPTLSVIPFSEKKDYLKRRPISKARNYFWSNIQATLSRSNNTLASVIPSRVTSIYQSAFLVAQEIASKLEQKRSFRQISRIMFQQVGLCHYIKGIRISCSGRINGAEIAKTECKKYGETSLHVFSDQIDYAQAKAFTPSGVLGVKVWISYL